MKDKILLLHGALGSTSQMNGVRLALQDHFEIFDFDFIGHGSKAKEGTPFLMSDLANEVISFIENQIKSPTHVFGYSMGGYAALLAAKSKPELFRSITTLGTKLQWTEDIARREMRMLDAEVIMQKVPKFAEHLEQVHGNQWRTLLSHTAAMMMELGESPKLSAQDVKQLQMPINIITGDLDQTADPAYSKSFAQEAGVSFFTLENTPHPIAKVDIPSVVQIILHHTTHH